MSTSFRGEWGVAVSLIVASCADGSSVRGDSVSGTDGSVGSAETVDDGGSGADDAASSGADTMSADESSGGAPAGACLDEHASRSSLAFDGIDDQVTMGIAPELGLATFTVEAWVRRDAAGLDFGTGEGGLRLVPIAGKGRGENDDTVHNCNYAFGFSGNVLGADFEDMATGLNHPVVGTTTIPWGEWHHLAATFDGAAWRLYVDGMLDGQADTTAVPRSDSIQHFALGTSMDSAGVPAGYLAGSLDEVRIWDHARTPAEIAESMYATLEAGEGLVARWALDEADGGVVDSVGAMDGTLAGATFVGDGAVLDDGTPPSVVSVAPADAGTLPAGSVDLEILVEDDEDDEFVATFHLRDVSDADDFTIVVLPDTQFYSDPDSGHDGYPDLFHAQTQWVRDNREAYNIVAVIHNGDIVNHGARPEEWVIANAAMARLETPEDALPEGVPYGVCIGNHDQNTNGIDGQTAAFNTHFGIDRFAGRAYYGGHYGSTNDENWITFAAGGLEFVVVNLEYDTTPDPAVLSWTRSVFEAHPDAFGVLNTHYLLNNSGEFGTQGQAIYDALRSTENVHLMTSGHISNEHNRTDVFEGHPIHTMLADYQSDPEGGGGYMRIWEFSPANDELTVRSYSPAKDMWLTDENSEFTLEVDLPGAGGPFTEVAVVDPAAGMITTSVDALVPGHVYEWYATVDDCAHTVTLPVQRFTTQP